LVSILFLDIEPLFTIQRRLTAQQKTQVLLFSWNLVWASIFKAGSLLYPLKVLETQTVETARVFSKH
jgi:hypothetical protein